MRLHQILYDLRKTARRIRRRSVLASQRQLNILRRRFERILSKLSASLRVRRALAAWAFAAGSLTLAATLKAATPSTNIVGNSVFTVSVDPFKSMPTDQDNSADYVHAAFGDLDNDGDLDMVSFHDGGDNFRSFTNIGSASSPLFEELSGSSNLFYGVYANSNYASMSLGDLDNDGDLDLVIGDGTYVRFFQNTGTNSAAIFTEQSGSYNPFDSIAPNGSYSYYLTGALVDIDNDGDLDYFVNEGDYYYSSGTIRYFKNTGTAAAAVLAEETGSNNPLDGFTFNSYYGVAFPSFGDLDNDGDLDLLVGSFYANYYGPRHFENTGTAAAPAFSDQGYLTGLKNDYWTGTLVDIDGDNDLDYASGSDEEALVIWRNAGSASSFLPSQPVLDEFASGREVFADYDSDGDLDFVSTSYETLRNDAGQFKHAYNLGQDPFAGLAYFPGAIADFDGDGDKDMASVSGGYPTLFTNDSSNNFSSWTGPGSPFYGVGSLSAPSWSIATDIDKDGDLDVLYHSSYGGNHSFFRNTGTSLAPAFTAESGPGTPFDALSTSSWMKPFFMDLDADGDEDLVLVDTNNNAQPEAYRNNSGTFTLVPSASSPFNGVILPSTKDSYSSTGTIYLADFDSDGDKDFYLQENGNGKRWWYLINNLPSNAPGVDNLAKDRQKILAGPVPAKQGDPICLYLDKPSPNVTLEIFNAVGEKVISGLSGLNANGNPCVTANMAPGFYWAVIKDGERSFTQKLIVEAR